MRRAVTYAPPTRRPTADYFKDEARDRPLPLVGGGLPGARGGAGLHGAPRRRRVDARRAGAGGLPRPARRTPRTARKKGAAAAPSSQATAASPWSRSRACSCTTRRSSSPATLQVGRPQVLGRAGRPRRLLLHPHRGHRPDPRLLRARRARVVAREQLLGRLRLRLLRHVVQRRPRDQGHEAQRRARQRPARDARHRRRHVRRGPDRRDTLARSSKTPPLDRRLGRSFERCGRRVRNGMSFLAHWQFGLSGAAL